jgi:hypothetical protein
MTKDAAIATNEVVDLSQFDTRAKSEEGVWFDLKINGRTVKGTDKKPVRFKFKGAGDPEVQQFFLSSRRKGDPETPEDALKDDLQLMRLATLDWTDNFQVDGKSCKFSRDNIDVVFSIPMIRAWAVGQIVNLQDFMQGS